MKILSVNKFFYLYGGSDRYFFELNELHQRHGNQVIPFAMESPKNLPTEYERYFVSGVDYWGNNNYKSRIKAASRVFYSSEAREKVNRLIKNTNPDIAHIHLIYHQISPSILPIIQEAGIPIIQTLHDYKPVCPTYSLVSKNKICERCKGNRFYNAAIQRCNHDSIFYSGINSIEMYLHHSLGWYDIPNMFITPSEFMRNKLVEFGMPPEKMFHIPNFVDQTKFTQSNQSDNYFVYIGRLVPIKGLKTLLQAMKKVNGNTQLLLIGEGPQRSELEKMAWDLDLRNVRFLGHLEFKDLTNVISRAKFCVLPSEVYENCPMAVLESMAIGKPVIGSRIGGIPELISDGEDGLLFEAGNSDELAEKIDWMIRNSKMVVKMGGNARKKVVQEYNPQIHYQKVMHLYSKILN